jgi:hypothetical protein
MTRQALSSQTKPKPWTVPHGNDRWYEVNVPVADRLYDEHLAELKKEGLING